MWGDCLDGCFYTNKPVDGIALTRQLVSFKYTIFGVWRRWGGVRGVGTYSRVFLQSNREGRIISPFFPRRLYIRISCWAGLYVRGRCKLFDGCVDHGAWAGPAGGAREMPRNFRGSSTGLHKREREREGSATWPLTGCRSWLVIG